MRVLQMIDTLDGGGAERMAVNIANGLSQNGIISFLCATRRSGILEDQVNKEVEFLVLNKKSVLQLKTILQLRKYLIDNKIEVLHAHSTSIYTGFLVKLIYFKIKLIWHDHYGMSDYIEDRPYKLIKMISKYFAAIVSCNKVLKNWAQEKLKFKNAVYISNFSKHNSSQELVTKIRGIEGKRIICLANLRSQKNQYQLVSIFNKLDESYKDWTLHLVGSDQDDEYSCLIKNKIKQFALEDRVFIYGSCSDISAILRTMDIGVLTSISEGLPLAILEYGLAGLPVLTTTAGLLPEVVGNAGLLIKNIDKDTLPLLKAYLDKKALRIKNGKLLKQRIENKYSEKVVINRLIDLYEELI